MVDSFIFGIDTSFPFSNLFLELQAPLPQLIGIESLQSRFVSSGGRLADVGSPQSWSAHEERYVEDENLQAPLWSGNCFGSAATRGSGAFFAQPQTCRSA